MFIANNIEEFFEIREDIKLEELYLIFMNSSKDIYYI